jgi:hypothetical protein
MAVMGLYRVHCGMINEYEAVCGMRIGRGILGIRRKATTLHA